MVCLGLEPGRQDGRRRWIHWAMNGPLWHFLQGSVSVIMSLNDGCFVTCGRIDKQIFVFDGQYKLIGVQTFLSKKYVTYSVTSKKLPNVYKSCQMSIKVAQKWFHSKIKDFWHLYKNCLRMLANWLWPKALKSCPKSYKLPYLVTLVT